MMTDFIVKNPYDGTLVGKVRNNSTTEVQSVLDGMSQYSIGINDRIDVLNNVIALITERKEFIANLITSETGLAIKHSMHEVARSINTINYGIAVGKKLDSKQDYDEEYKVLGTTDEDKIEIVKEPLGLIVAMTPFNHPLNLVCHKIIPAIIAGAPIVLKPSEKTPLTAELFHKLLLDSGLPEDVFCVVNNAEPELIVPTLVNHPKTELVTFTGSTNVGRQIQKIMSTDDGLRVFVPELGGNCFLIIDKNSDIQEASKLCLAAFENSGQRCTSVKHILVHDDDYDAFCEKFTEKVNKLSIGDPQLSSTDMGTVINSTQARFIQDRVNRVVKLGAVVLTGNTVKGAQLTPTIVTNLEPVSELITEETFGPIVTVLKYSKLEEAIKIVKQSPYKLACGMMTENKDLAKSIASQLKVGQFSINGAPGFRTEGAPFGGNGFSGNGLKEGIVQMTKHYQRERVVYTH